MNIVQVFCNFIISFQSCIAFQFALVLGCLLSSVSNNFVFVVLQFGWALRLGALFEFVNLVHGPLTQGAGLCVTSDFSLDCIIFAFT